MAPKETFRIPLRWEFSPSEQAKDQTIRWEWRAYTQAGEIVMRSERAFDTFTDCVEDAKSRGYAE